jgi:hypothetical protein
MIGALLGSSTIFAQARIPGVVSLLLLPMPFYVRTPSPRPLWHPAAAGAGVMLVWALVQAFLLPKSVHPGALHLLFVILGLSLVGGIVAGALGWVLGLPVLGRSLALRWAAGTAATMIFLIGLTLAASQAEPGGPWSRVTRSSFLLSTLLLAVVIGWIVARDPFKLARTEARVYLTPGAFAALSQSERDRLRPESEGSAPSEKIDRAS